MYGGTRVSKAGYKASKAFFKPVPSARKVASDVKRLKKKVRNLNPEPKICVESQTGQAIGTAMAFYLLNEINEGDTEFQRNGVKVRAKHLRFVWNAYSNLLNAASDIRCIIFEDRKAPLATLPTMAEVLETSNNFMSGIEHLNRSRFKVLYDSTAPLNLVGQYNITRKLNKRLNSVYEYSDGTGTNTEGRALYAAFISSNNVQTTQVGFHSTLTFTDV